jgi:DnaJ family protein C protein 28
LLHVQPARPDLVLNIELENAVQTFRANLRQSWVRRTLRNLTTSHPQQLLSKLTTSDVEALRDPDWVRREQSYHDVAIAELNDLVRKHNVLAPYAVRRRYYERAVEIEKMYEISAGDILKGIEKHGRELEMERLGQSQKGLRGDDDGGGGSPSLQIPVLEGNFGHVARRWWLGKLIRRWLDMIWWRPGG